MAFREAVFAEALDLLEDAFCIVQFIAFLDHAAHQPVVKRAEAALPLPGRHGTAQLVGFARREVGGQDGQLHHLLLKDRHAQRALQRLAHFVAGVVHRLFAAAAAQVGVHHAALDGAGADDGDFNHQVVKTARLQARQHAHLGPAFDLEGADTVAPAQHLVAGFVFGRHFMQRHRLAELVAHHFKRAADGAEHAQGQDVDLQKAQRVQIIFVPLDDAAVCHGGVFHRHQQRQVVARDDEAAGVLAQVAREADQL